jgi:protein-tyrosine phosphatase
VTDSRFRILTVCTGNICRSPVAERLLVNSLGDKVAVSSAGVHAVVGAPIHPGMVALLEESGVPSGRFVARRLTSRDILGADLVLGLTREHRAYLVQEVPAAVRRSFTLLEFARLVTSPDLPSVPSTPVDVRLRALVRWAARHRAAPQVGDWDDVPDPYGHGEAEYELAYGLIHDAVDTIARAARG